MKMEGTPRIFLSKRNTTVDPPCRGARHTLIGRRAGRQVRRPHDARGGGDRQRRRRVARGASTVAAAGMNVD